MAERKKTIEANPTLLGLADALLETVLALENAAGVSAKEMLGRSRHDPLTQKDRYGVAATGGALVAAYRPSYSPLRKGAPATEAHDLVARVPALPSAKQLTALLHDHMQAQASTTDSEKRLSKAHLELVKLLRSGKLNAWASWTVTTRRGEVFAGPIAEIEPELWNDLAIEYSASFDDEYLLTPTCDARIVGWRGRAGGREVEGELHLTGVVVDLNQLLATLNTQPSAVRELTLIRPRAEGGDWAVRVDNAAPIRIPFASSNVGLNRGLQSLWVMINAPEARLPYILLLSSDRRDANTQPAKGNAAEKEAKRSLLMGLKKVFDALMAGELPPANAYCRVQSELTTQIRKNKDGAGYHEFGDILEALTTGPVPGAVKGSGRTSDFVIETKRTVRRNLEEATAAIRQALGSAVPGMPVDLEHRLGPILDEWLVHKHQHWVVFAPPPSLCWRAEVTLP